MARYDGCLTSLTPQSQRLLSLRAGLNGTPRSAVATARILHLSAGRERLVERASLLALQTAAGGGCAGDVSGARGTATGASDDLVAVTPALLTASASSLPSLSSQPAATVSPTSQTGSGHPTAPGQARTPPVQVTSSATRTLDRASTGFPAVAVALFASLALVISLLLLPGVQRRLIPAGARGAAPGGSTRGATMSAPAPSAPAAGAVVAAGTAGALATETPSPGAQGPSGSPAGGSSQPRPAPAPDPQAEVAPVVQSSNRPRAARTGPRAAWAREHATQAALVAGVIAGGAVRLLTRGRGRRS